MGELRLNEVEKWGPTLIEPVSLEGEEELSPRAHTEHSRVGAREEASAAGQEELPPETESASTLISDF